MNFSYDFCILSNLSLRDLASLDEGLCLLGLDDLDKTESFLVSKVLAVISFSLLITRLQGFSSKIYDGFSTILCFTEFSVMSIGSALSYIGNLTRFSRETGD